MIRLFSILGLILCLATPCQASTQIDTWLEEAVKDLTASSYMGDTSSAERRLLAILEEDPTHLEAMWLLTNIRITPFTNNRSLIERAEGLFAFGPAFEKIVTLAKEKGNPAFGHYVMARYASMYKAYPRALSEINKALSYEPDSTWYLYTKGKILVGKGDWERKDEEMALGIRILKKAYRQSKTHPTLFVDEEDFHFSLAWSMADLSEPPWEEVIKHYLAAIKHQPQKNMSQAYAWNNASIAYQELGQCQKAKEAAEQALEIAEFGAAQSNKANAEFCLEMRNLGLMPSTETASN